MPVALVHSSAADDYRRNIRDLKLQIKSDVSKLMRHQSRAFREDVSILGLIREDKRSIVPIKKTTEMMKRISPDCGFQHSYHQKTDTLVVKYDRSGE